VESASILSSEVSSAAAISQRRGATRFPEGWTGSGYFSSRVASRRRTSGRLGFPIVNTGCEFFKPCHLGDRLVLELTIARLGRSSIEFSVVGRVGGEEKFRARHKVALMSLDSLRALPIPEDLREKMKPFVV
jgi:acyl-CoA thioesterase FadM